MTRPTDPRYIVMAGFFFVFFLLLAVALIAVGVAYTLPHLSSILGALGVFWLAMVGLADSSRDVVPWPKAGLLAAAVAVLVWIFLGAVRVSARALKRGPRAGKDR